MNLIGHLECAEHLPPDARLGAILPDLLSLYDRSVRPLKLLQGGFHRLEAASVRDGVRFHYHVDSHFHRSALFRDGCRTIRERLVGASGTPGLKRFAVAHVLTELFLDHLLIVEDSARLGAFYDALNGHKGGALEALLAGRPELDWGGFSAFIDRLVALRFADEYLEREGLLNRTDRILTRLGQRRLERRERDALLEGLAGHAAQAQRQLDGFLLDMRAWHPRAADDAHRALDSAAAPGVDSGGPAGIK
jgi:hypothetical protein